MKIKLLKGLACLALCAITFSCSNKSNQQVISNYSASIQDKEKIHQLIVDEKFSEAIYMSDSLFAAYPIDPQLPVLKGFAYYLMGDMPKKDEAFTEAIKSYDNLLAVRPDLSDELNKAICILFTEGDEAYQKYLDGIEQNENYKDNAEYVAGYRIVTIDEIIGDAFFSGNYPPNNSQE